MTVQHTDQELLQRVRKAVNGARAVMVGVTGAELTPFAPMKGHVVEGETPVWFIGRDTIPLVRDLGGQAGAAMVNVVSEDHHLHASLIGSLVAERDQGRIDLFWNSVTDAWLPEGRHSPNIVVLRFDPQEAEVWISDNAFKLAWEVAKANYNHQEIESGERATIRLS